MAINTNGLTTVARIKTFLGISGTTYDTILERLINMVSDFVEGYCDRTFRETANSNEIYDGTGTNKLLLKNYPVDDSATFTLEERAGDYRVSSWNAIDAELYHVLWNEGIVDFLGNRFREIPRHYRITYTSGYDFDNVTPGNTLESQGIGDLEYAVWKLVANAFRKRKHGTNVKSESIGDYSVSFRASTMTDQEIKDILDGYKRPHPM